MSLYTTRLSDADRLGLSVPPPPEYDKRGELLGSDLTGREKYQNAALLKEKNVVYVDEELDLFEHPASLRHFRMMVRCMPWESDLDVIMQAARHMMLLESYSFTFEQRAGLSPELEHGYWDVRYVAATEAFHLDNGTEGRVPVHITHALRKQIWLELFSALGHKVKWGDRVLNVKRK